MNTNTQEVREYIDLAMKCTRYFHPDEWNTPEKRLVIYKNRILYLECAVEYYHKGMTISEMKKVLSKWVFKKVNGWGTLSPSPVPRETTTRKEINQ